MKHHKSILLLAGLAFIFSGCSNKDKEAQQRLEQQRQAEADAAKGNKAITNMNQSMFSKMNASTPGATATTTAAPSATTNPPAQSTTASSAPAASSAANTATQTAVNPPPNP
jgi:TRAP-type C4-dicarboxylate transport system permease large subunit